MSLRIGGQLVSPLSSIDRGGDVVGTFINTTSDAVLDIVDIIYPIGSIYLSVNNANPSTLFGGTWVQIKDKFLLSAGDTYSGGDTGGEATHTLTIDEMPSHTHSSGSNSDGFVAHATGGGSYSAGYVNASGEMVFYRQPENSGEGQAHNNMPPYLAVYVWQRTA